MNPSLLLIPDRYKASKLYSQIPDTGAGDLAFTRALDTATRVGSDGLIEKVRTNLVLNSATLATQDVTVSANPHTISFFGTGSIVVSGVASGTLVGTGVGDRVELSVTTTAGTLNLTVSGTVTNAQLETGDIATPYIPTTTAAVSVGMTEDIPRIDYTGGGCGKLLLEPQRTNLALFSEQLNNAEYTTDNATFSANAGVSPDGFVNADLLTENSSNATHGFFGPVVTRASAGQPLTTSIFAKTNGRRFITLIGGFDSGNAYFAIFDLQLGVVATTGNAGSTTLLGATITDFGNGYYRCAVIGQTNGLVNRLLFIFLADTATGQSALGLKTYTGNGTAGVFLYGLQVEAGSYATSYIPTLGAAVTRSADSASKTGISALIGQTSGSAMVDVNLSLLSSSGVLLTLSNGTFANFIILAISASNQIDLAYRTNAGAVNVFTTAASAGRSKIAVGYQAGNIVFFVNGVLINTGSVDVNWSAALSRLDLGNEIDVTARLQNHNTAALYNTRLSNSQLASLTTL